MYNSKSRIGITAAALLIGLFTTGSSASAATYEVTLEGLSFVYNGQTDMDIDLTISPGDTVRWVWVSGLHNVASGFPPEPNGGELFFSGEATAVPGTTFEYTFTEPGLYGYHCEIHEDVGMFSSVMVAGAVPTVSEWGLVVMTLLGFAVATVAFKRTRTA